MPKLAANLNMLFTEVPLRQRFAAAAASGFDAVELHYPYELAPAELSELLAANALRLVLFNSRRGDADEHGLACGRAQEARFFESIEDAARYAEATRCAAVHVLTGMVKVGQDGTEAYHLAVKRLGEAAERLSAAGVVATVEALNSRDMPGYLLDTTARAVRFIEDVGASNLRLQLDVYHAEMGGEDAVALLNAFGRLIGHVQIADVPGRHEPGTGRLDLDLILARLDSSGYRHWVGCEYRPLGDTAEGLRWADVWLRRAPASKEAPP
jgi:hydroxypyruvate isomerase